MYLSLSWGAYKDFSIRVLDYTTKQILKKRIAFKPLDKGFWRHFNSHFYFSRFYATLNQMNDIIKKFNAGFRWNAFESIFYKAVLLVHQTCLFYFASRLVYGFSSLLFAIIYLAVELINLGFDHSCAQLSVDYFSCKYNFRSYFIPQVVIQAAILGTLLIFIITNYQFINSKFLPASAFLTQGQWGLLGIIIVCEALRKTLRLIAQLLFLNKPAAILESSLILIYVALFWVTILIGYPIDIYTIYVPLLAQSVIGLIFLFYFIIPKLKLELQRPKIGTGLPTSIFRIRMQNYLYQLSELLFSSNFLIYFLSSITSLLAIGPIKLANYLAVFIKSLLERTFGLASLAIFIKNKHLLSSQKALFNATQRKLNLTLITSLLIFGTCVFSINFLDTNCYLALLFFCFTLINNFLIIYEQLFLVYNQILILFLLNILAILLSLGFIYLAPQASAANLIVLFIILRIITLLVVKSITHHFFKNH